MTHSPLPPFAATSGPRDAKLLIVGEAWGATEASVRRPFVGASGKEFWRMLGEAMPDVAPNLHHRATDLHRYGGAVWMHEREHWLSAAGIAMTNVLALQPPGNKIPELCGSKREVEELWSQMGQGGAYPMPAIETGKYLRPEYLSELTRLQEEITTINPNLILAAGAKAMWALCGATNIGSTRGTIMPAGELPPRSNGQPYKLLGTYHPDGVMRQWSWRPIVVTDLMKAAREMQSPAIVRPSRAVEVAPQLDDIRRRVGQLLESHPPLVACDIETTRGQIKMISLAWARDRALVVPFINDDGTNYWPTIADEAQALQLVAQVLEAPQIPKLWQNGMYDLQYLFKYGIAVRNNAEDTMLLHHSLFPEMLKGLGFLGSIYTSEPAWKLMRRTRPDTEKRDE